MTRTPISFKQVSVEADTSAMGAIHRLPLALATEEGGADVGVYEEVEQDYYRKDQA